MVLGLRKADRLAYNPSFDRVPKITVDLKPNLGWALANKIPKKQ
jgi:hypothetical protein